ncbi:methyltransferase domain-containing protein [Methylosinus sporium]|uniref:Protein-L-isoaspartate O-methyltransferase n=2 Tax=Methylosinus sporium TaxID=428 RepID=A0A549SSY2_METSR|nr:methyltransferase domain-containing protein [Methylosinus sporium]
MIMSFITYLDPSLMNDAIAAARRAYAEELLFTTHMRSPALLAAFASVPRERFLGPGPWRVRSDWDFAAGYWTTADADPRHVYHDVLIALDESLGLNNGRPALWAFLLDRLNIAPNESVIHLGCGAGYYTAILAELVGPRGRVTALDIHQEIAAKARRALSGYDQVAVEHADGAKAFLTPADVIVASAGATHPLPGWLAVLKVGGRLLFPMTPTQGHGGMLLIQRLGEQELSARFLCGAAFYEFSGARDPEISARLTAAIARDRGAGVKSLRCDAHAEDETCWLHGEGWCLSRTPLPEGSAA